ncbi:hypothetical protein D9V32_15505 [Mycetocola tolaasinivorans]|uniref:Uncharacterized protein n=1 Tax=Mycetocola tolaasinivorans TaxID=76635 RepID=A0A3L6ZWN9_9MICO|nr:hypothetical protein [Mycetocola tolaasinivorans]RLP72299.1 hypothetical protein D9V32_15505 [Mycetocola tolaasinivorans]
MGIRFPKITRTESVRVEPDGAAITVAEVAIALAALDPNAEVTSVHLDARSSYPGGTRNPTGALILSVKKIRTAGK